MSLFSALRDGYADRNRNRARKARRDLTRPRSGRPRLTTKLSALVETLESRQLLTALITTNQPDYAPGSTAIFTTSNDATPGPNFAPGETVHFHIDRTDGIPVQAPPPPSRTGPSPTASATSPPTRTPPASGPSPTPTAPPTAISTRTGTLIPNSPGLTCS